MNLNPLSDPLLYAVGGEYEPIVANFADLKAHWSFEDYVSGTDWVDRIGGVIFRDVLGFVKDANGICQGSGSSQTMVGTIVCAGQPVIVVQGNFAAGANHIIIGDVAAAAQASVAIAAAAGEYCQRNVTNYKDIAAIAGFVAGQACYVLHVDNDADLTPRKYIANSLGTWSGSAVAGVDALGTLAGTYTFGGKFNIFSASQASRCAHIFVLDFPTGPVNALDATKWMAANFGKIFSGWARKAA